MMITYLQQKPHIGIISGLGSGLLVRVQYLLTDDHILKMVSGMATWAGCGVAILTLFGWSIKIIHQFKSK